MALSKDKQQVNFSLEKQIVKKLRLVAKRKNRSLSGMIRHILIRWHAGQ